MTRKPLFWIVFSALGAAGFVIAVWLFPRAFPIIDLDIEMDQATAIEQAAELAAEYGWSPADARSATTFGQLDFEVQTYVELEGGGRDAFVNLADENIYHPYGWSVRRFEEGSIEESLVRFTPDGRAYGFRLRLSEDDPGNGNLSDEEALAVGEAAAAEWGVDLTPFELLESSQQTLPGGRIDHTIVFERGDVSVADAQFRLRVTVAGEGASELTHFVQVPEAFSQRFADMRAANDAIALVSQGFFLLVFGILAAGIGTVVLMRQRWVLWRKPLIWGGITALLLGLNQLNALPLAWNAYDTAVSAGVFLSQQIGTAVLILVAGTPLIAFFYLAGESLGRRAFPAHPQQWRFWSPEVAASSPALGRTIAAYLLAGMQLGYVVLFYLGTSRLDGWWSPAEALVQPDLLATFQPWLMAVSNSLLAAFWEESLFRAVPIACAALLGARYGRKGVWIWIAIILQAVIFAAGHANYPQQPAYARVVELSVPALIWGVAYLYFGLVPTVLAHFTYDLSLFSIPLFASDTPGVWFDRAIVILVGLLPLAIVLNARRKGRARSNAPDWAYNRAWRPPELPADATGAGPADASLETAEEPPRRDLPVAPTVVFVLGALGAAVWLFSIGSGGEVPRLTQSRTEAIATAREALETQGNSVEEWTAMAATPFQRGDDHRYVFEEAGEAAYTSLLGRYLGEPRWSVRFIDFEAEAEERVDQFQVQISPAEEVLRVVHILPEAREGAQLEEDTARTLALGHIVERFDLDPARLVEVVADQTARPNRVDWVFVFEDPDALPEVEGEGRVTVRLAGDELTDLTRSVDVPEEWQRSRRDAATRRTLIGIGLAVLLVLMAGTADVLAIVALAKGTLVVRVLVVMLPAALVVMALSQANSWPAITAQFIPAQPWGLQAGAAAFGIVLVTLVGAAAIALLAALAHSWHRNNLRQSAPALGVALGFAVVGAGGIAEMFFGPFGGLPRWPDPSGAVSFVPVLTNVGGPIVPFLLSTSALLLLGGLALRTGLLPKIALWTAVLAVGFVDIPESVQESAVTWVAVGVGIGILNYFVVRFVAAIPALAPVIFATILAAQGLGAAVDGAYPGARVGGVMGAIVLVAIALVWTRALSHRGPDG